MALNLSIAGVTGYTGMKLLQLLRAHPGVCRVRVAARSGVGEPLTRRLPFLAEAEGLTIEPLEALGEEPGDALLCCLPSGAATPLIAHARSHGARVIDLGGDHRLRDSRDRQRWYPEVASTTAAQTAVYGLTEHARDAISGSFLVANPGCYATAALLALVPLWRGGMRPFQPIIVDAKSGVSGAGRGGLMGTQLAEMHDQIAPYATGRSHRHVPEIEQALSQWSGRPESIVFTPHLVPADRGVLACAYVRLDPRTTVFDVRALYARAYKNEPFVRLLPEGAFPNTRSVRGSNRCDIALHWCEETSTLVTMAALDNLIKGAAGQAVQNLNLMFGLAETEGLSATGDPL
ncbi:MAG: N-acetyl-gamma-glutamyl-phosphate reductase [Acidobacteriota bacterium]